MKTFALGSTELQVPAVVAGVMRIQDKSDAEVRAWYEAALASGISYFDHADIYGDGDAHGCETRFAEALQLSSAERESIVLQSKAGIVKNGPYFDFSYAHIIDAVSPDKPPPMIIASYSIFNLQPSDINKTIY